MILYILYQFLRGLILFILWYVIIMNSISLLQMVAALFITPVYITKSRRLEYRFMGASQNMIPISLLVPAHNEEPTIVDSIKSMLNLNYTNYEIVVINDGSEDNTLETVINAFGLHKIIYPVRERLPTKKIRGIYYNPDIPRLRLIDKENGGKSDALNAGINLSIYPYIVSLDADSLLDVNALLRIAMAFIQDKYTVAVGGIIRLANGCLVRDGKIMNIGLPKKIWPLFQTIEYFRSFLVGRIGWNSFNSLLIVSGAFGAFQKEFVLSVGGYTTGTVGEDMDLVIKLHRYMQARKYKYRVSFLPDPVCWTQAPETLNVLHHQRRRWQIGLIDVLSRNLDMLFKPRCGALGMIAMPYYFLFEMVSPVIELLGYILIPLACYFGFVSLDTLELFLIAAVGFGIITSMGSLLVEELTNSQYIKIHEVLLLNFLAIAENLFYRQMTVFFRLTGIFSFRKNKSAWGAMKREKFKND